MVQLLFFGTVLLSANDWDLARVLPLQSYVSGDGVRRYGTLPSNYVPEAGLTLPSPHYLRHPPQPISPSSPFPLERELASLEKAAAEQPHVVKIEEKEYSLRTKVVEIQPNGEHVVLLPPRITTVEGQLAQFAVTDWVERTDADGAATHTQGQSRSLWHVRMTEAKNGQVHLDLSMQKHTREKTTRKGHVAQGDGFHVVREMTPARTVKVILDRDDRGTTRRWVELTVDVAAPEDAQQPAAEEQEEVHPFWYEPF